jgi:glycerate kinase
LQALGFQFLNKKGKSLSNMPESLTELDSIDVSGVDKRIDDCELVILCDVENVLLGKEGAAAVFGPQKGASPPDVKKLDASLSKLRDIVLKQTGKDMAAFKHGGAAGGTAAGLASLLHAQLVNGIDHFLSLTGFDTALTKADLVITGEGSIDEQTLQGKGPFGVAKRAKQNQIPVIGLAGKLPLETSADLQEYFGILLPINNELMDIAEALQNTRANLIRTARAVGDMLAVTK